jgi:molybdopterin synthase catalytic subunit
MAESSFVLSLDPPPATPPFALATTVGATVCFEGIVRDNNEGKPVLRLEYTAYEKLAEREGTRIVLDAVARFGLLAAACVHRIGTLEIGETAVKVWAAAAHRGAAFAACAFIIDEIKASVPIWKRENYRDGQRAWVSCQHSPIERGGEGHAPPSVRAGMGR